MTVDVAAGAGELLRERVTVVLVEPLSPGNVGAVARAMATMGIERLALVNPCPLDNDEWRIMAIHAHGIVERARICRSLPEALEGINYAVATTRRQGRARRAPFTPRSLARDLLGLLAENRVALVFGREDRGLTNEEVDLCQGTATIPSHPGFTSLNLSHAVTVFLWELRAACEGLGEAPARPNLAEASEVEGMYAHLRELLLRVGYLDEHNPERMIRAIKRIFGRAGLELRDVRIIRGILRQFEWYAGRRRGDAHTGKVDGADPPAK